MYKKIRKCTYNFELGKYTVKLLIANKKGMEDVGYSRKQRNRDFYFY